MSKLPFMPFYGQQFTADGEVRRMSAAEKGVYVELLWFQWSENGLPADPTELERMVGDPVSARVLQRFPISDDGKRRNPALEVIRKRHLRTSKARAKAANDRHHKPLGPVQNGCKPDANAPQKAGKLEGRSKRLELTTKTTPLAPARGGWVGEAHEALLGIGYFAPGRIGKALGGLVERFGWDEPKGRGPPVKPVLACWVKWAPYQRANGTMPTAQDNAVRNTQFTKPEKFAETFGEWAEWLTPLEAG